MNKKSVPKITQEEIEIAKQEYFKQGGVITFLTIHESETKKEINARRKINNKRNSP